MFKLIVFTLIFSLFTVSCSSKLSRQFEKKAQTNKRNEDLIKSFESEDNVLEKFKEVKQDSDEVISEISPEKTETVVKKKTPKKKLNVAVKKVAIKKKSKITKVVKTQIKKTNSIVKRSRSFPEGYTKEYKQIDKLTKKFWSEFKPIFHEGEEIFMDINYAGLSTGKIAITTMPKTMLGEKETYHFHARVKTSSYYSYLYELDDNVDTYVDTKNFTPVKFSLIQRESGQNIDDLQLFDSEKLQTYTYYKRVTKKKTKKYKEVKPTLIRFQDPLSIVYFLRGLPLEMQKKYTVPMMNKGKVLVLNATAQKIEELETEIGKKKAIKVIASTQYSGDTLKSGDMVFWFSADEDRIFLKFKAKIKIGSISGNIEKYER